MVKTLSNSSIDASPSHTIMDCHFTNTILATVANIRWACMLDTKTKNVQVLKICSLISGLSVSLKGPGNV